MRRVWFLEGDAKPLGPRISNRGVHTGLINRFARDTLRSRFFGLKSAESSYCSSCLSKTRLLKSKIKEMRSLFKRLNLARLFGALPLAVMTLCSLFWPASALARWATASDAEGATLSSSHEIEVHADGSFDETIGVENEVLREDGRNMSTYRLSYNSVAEELKVLEAETINGGDHISVESQYIEDKPSASRQSGFDQNNQVSIAFPKVTIGSRLRLKYRFRKIKTPIEGHYEAHFDFGTKWLVKERHIHIRSELPLFIQVNDPSKKLEVTESKEEGRRGGSYVLDIRLKAPIYTAVIDEPWPYLVRSEQTWVQISSHKNFSEIGNAVAPKIEAILSGHVPDLFEKIKAHAANKSTLVDKFNQITSELAEEVRYMGDWRAVNGGQIPRALDEVASTKFGDCKDFSAATIVILRKLGIKANMAWVERGVQPTQISDAPALHGVFNHAIVVAEAEGRLWWLDPTNFASFGQGIFEDIVGRKALVIDLKNSRLGEIPEATAPSSIRESQSHIALQRNGNAAVDTSIGFRGRAAASFTGILLRQSKEHFDHVIMTSLTDEDRLKSFVIDPYDLSSRVTKDFTLHVRFEELRSSMRTTAGPAYSLDSRLVEQLMRVDPRRRVSGLYLGHPHTVRDTDFLENVDIVGGPPPECHLDTPWVSVFRKVIQTPQGVRILDGRVIKKAEISNFDLKSKTFTNFQNRLQECFDRVAVILKSKTRNVRTAREISSIQSLHSK